MRTRRLFSPLAVVLALGIACWIEAAGEEPPAFTPTADYVTRDIHGWTVRVNPALAAKDPKLERATLAVLENQLFQVTRMIPPAALERIRKVVIWVELDMPKTACMCYHVSRHWLGPNGYNPEKEGSVEIGNARAFLEWTKGQPWMVLHELAHGYHDKVFGYDDPRLREAWQRMLDSGKYDRVGHIGGGTRRHYALENPMEYFAETTEALYGTNDFHPYVRSELKDVDPEGMELVRSYWELDPVPAGPSGSKSSPEPDE